MSLFPTASAAVVPAWGPSEPQGWLAVAVGVGLLARKLWILRRFPLWFHNFGHMLTAVATVALGATALSPGPPSTHRVAAMAWLLAMLTGVVLGFGGR